MIRNIFFIVIGMFFLFQTYLKVIGKRFSEKESFLWMVGSIGVISMPALIPILDSASYIIGIDYPPSLAFMVLLLFAFILIFRITQTISIQSDLIKELGHKIALMDNELNSGKNE